MEPVAAVLGIGIISFLLIYFGFKLDEDHNLLKILTVLMAFVLLIMIPKVIIDFPSNCEIVIDSQNTTEDILNATHTITNTDYNYTQYCGESKTTGVTLLKTYYGVYTLIILYSLIYLVYYVYRKRGFKK